MGGKGFVQQALRPTAQDIEKEFLALSHAMILSPSLHLAPRSHWDVPSSLPGFLPVLDKAGTRCIIRLFGGRKWEKVVRQGT